jgi:hypothetical protein
MKISYQIDHSDIESDDTTQESREKYGHRLISKPGKKEIRKNTSHHTEKNMHYHDL